MDNVIINLGIAALDVFILTWLFYRSDNGMKKKKINEFLGEKCRIFIEESGKERIHVNTGIICDFNRRTGSVKVQSNHGTFQLNIKSILTIKPLGNTKIS